MIDYKEFFNKSVAFLVEYAKENHLESYVIGISGGIDSTISACLASEACKQLGIPLIGRSLPTGTNKQDEVDVADLVGNAFCSDYKVVALDKPYFALEDHFEFSENTMTDLQKGNIKARLRMMYLRNLASIHKGVVLDNDNFTEYNLGFWTIAGDSPMDVNCGIHYLWKTEIYELAKYLSNYYRRLSPDGRIQEYFDKVIAIDYSFALTPTDGNGVSNSDCEQFGLENYEQVDDVLKTMYYSNHYIEGADKMILEAKKEDRFIVNSKPYITYEDGTPVESPYIRLIDSYNEQGVDKVMLLHQNTEYKRKELPIKPTKKELGL